MQYRHTPPPTFGVDLQLIGNKEALTINYHQNLENINISKTHNVSFVSKLCRHSAIKRVLRLLYRAQNKEYYETRDDRQIHAISHRTVGER